MREAGLPILTPDVHGDRQLFSGSKGVVRALHPDLWRVDIETEEGSLLTYALVIGPYFPELHADGDAPSHVGYFYVRGMPDALCWPMPHRRLLGPEDVLEGQAGQDQPERRYYALHNYIFRSGDITWRVTKDNVYVFESEEGDYLSYDQNRREFRIHGPTVFVGTETETRAEYQRDTEYRVVMPKILMGDQALLDTDGITYLKDILLHLVSTEMVQATAGTEILLEAPLIKLSADNIILDPVNIKLGHASATERVMLGDLWKAFYNVFITLFNAHQHSNVQNGPSTSGTPTTSAASMDDSMLSDVTHVSKSGV